MAILERIKLSLRISHNLLDDEINACITSARLEMERAGVSDDKAFDESDELVFNCIRAYVLMNYASDSKLREGYLTSFQYQLDNLRKSREYSEDV